MQYPSLSLEYELLKDNTLIAGVDEVGRGCLAGPVCACVVVLNQDTLAALIKIPLIRDSKTLSALQRETLFNKLVQILPDFGVGYATPQEIDERGIRYATYLAMLRAYWKLATPPDVLLMDGERATIPIFSKTFQFDHGDQRHTSIAVASIVAKVTRDRLMTKLENSYPGYGFAQHKGYGTSQHYESLSRLGVSKIHRKSFLRNHL